MKRLLSLLVCLSMLLSLVPAGFSFAEEGMAAEERAVVALDTPTGLTTGDYDVTYNTVYFQWDDVTDATAYEVQYRLTTASSWTTFGTVADAYCTVTGLTCGKEYYFRVRAVADDGTVSYSQWSSMVRNTPRPEEPWPYSVTQKTTTSVEITWSQVTGAQGYYIYRADNGGERVLIKTFTGNTTFAYVDSGLAVGSTYVYEVAAYRKVDGVAVEGVHSSPMEIKLLPVAPANVKAAVASANSVKITWDAVAGASSYTVYRATSSGGTYSAIAEGLTGVTYTDSGLMTGATYYYYVTSVVSTGDSAESVAESEPSATVSCSPVLMPPQNFIVTGTTSGSVTLSWSPVALASGYRLYLSTDGTTWNVTDKVDLTDSEVSYTWTGLNPSTKYYFRIFAYVTLNINPLETKEMVSNGSQIVNAYTNPTTPADLVVEPLDFKHLSLTWDDMGETVDGYEIYRSTDNKTYTLINTIGNFPVYDDVALTCGTKYYYKVRAYVITADNTKIYSLFSNVDSGKPVPHAPENVEAMGLDGTSIKISWEGEDGPEDPINGASGYVIYQRVKGEDAFEVAAVVEGGSVMSYILTDMTPGVEMEFRVCAYRTVNGKRVEGDFSPVVGAIAKPLAPANVKVTLVNEKSLKVSWDASKGATGYDLYMYVDEKIVSEPKGVEAVAKSGVPLEAMTFVISTAETSYTVSGLIPGYTYEFRVVPFVDVDGFAVTGPASATAERSPRPVRPANLIGDATSLDSVTLTWDPTEFVAEGLKGYGLFYSDDLAQTWTLLIDLQDPEASSYIDDTVTVGQSRMYRIRSYIYSDGVQVFSVFSPAITVAPKPRTATSLKAVSDAFNTITLTFKGDLDPVKYLVYRSSTSEKTGFTVVGNVVATTASELTFEDVGVDIGVTYWYKLRPVYNNGSQNFYGDWSEVISAASRPAEPQNVSAVPTGVSTSKVSWDAVSGVTGYQLYRSSTENSGYKQVKSVSSNYISVSDDGLNLGQTYYYKVRAYRTVNGQTIYGAFSDPVKMVFQPVAPQEQEVASTTYNSITLKWKKMEGVDTFTINYFYVSYPDQDGNTELVEGSKTVAGTKTGVTITGLPLGVEVTFEVVSNVTVGDDVMTSADVATLMGKVRPARVTGVKATSLDQGTNQINWTAVPGATYYELECSYTGENGDWLVLSGAPNNTTYKDNAAVVGELIYYRVRAVGAMPDGTLVYGMYSDKVKLVSVPAKVKDLTIKSTNYNRLRLDWTHSDGADGYEIYRSTKSGSGYKLVKDTTNLYFANAGLTCGDTYYYKIRAYVEVGSDRYYSAYSAVVSGKPVPNVPGNVTATATTTTSAKITWKKVAGADGYEVTYKDTTATSYKTLGTTTKLNITQKDLKVGRTYQYRVRAYRLVDGEKVYGLYSTAVYLLQTPPVPENVTTTNTGTTAVQLDWDKCTGVDGYEVHYSLTSGGPYELKADVTGTTATITGMEMGRQAYFVVRSYGIKANGEKEYSPFSAEVGRKPRPTEPTLKIDSWDVTGITLKWNSIANVTGYVLYGKTAASDPWTVVANLTGSKVTSYRDTNLAVGSYHYYMIHSMTQVSDNGTPVPVYSQDSNVVYVQVVPAKVTLNAKAGGIDHVNLSWTASNGADQYVIKRATTKNGTYKRIATVDGSILNYADYDVQTGKTYYYVVIARCKVSGVNVDSASSNIDSAKAQPGKVTGVAVSRAGYNGIKVTWDKVTGADGYQIYVRQGSETTSRKLMKTVGDRSNTTVTGLTSGKTYYVEVRALVGEAGGAYSEMVKIKVLPDTPTGVKAAAKGDEKVRVSWSKVSGATGYLVFRATSENGTYKQVGSTTGTSITLTNQEAGVNYFYKVAAYRTVSGKKVQSTKSGAVPCSPEP